MRSIWLVEVELSGLVMLGMGNGGKKEDDVAQGELARAARNWFPLVSLGKAWAHQIGHVSSLAKSYHMREEVPTSIQNDWLKA